MTKIFTIYKILFLWYKMMDFILWIGSLILTKFNQSRRFTLIKSVKTICKEQVWKRKPWKADHPHFHYVETLPRWPENFLSPFFTIAIISNKTNSTSLWRKVLLKFRYETHPNPMHLCSFVITDKSFAFSRE